MQLTTTLKKMTTELVDKNKVSYYLEAPEHFIHMNQLLGKKLSFDFEGYQCLNCGKHKKIYRQGFCYDCFYASPKAADWILKPELSKAHLGIEDRELAYEEQVQLQPHIVYLALSSNIKVGVTRKSQLPTRWIDQGASKAIEILETPNRYLAGIAEVALKEHISDKTSWQKMLKNEIAEEDLHEVKEKLKGYLPEEVKPYLIENQHSEQNIEYPVLNYPKSVKSLKIDRDLNYSGILKGIKGQYLLFEDDKVFSIRGNEGSMVKMTIDS